MNATPCSSQVPVRINDVDGVNPVDLSSNNIRGRDIIIINPTYDGGGDHALAKKVANIALDVGCRVSIYSFDAHEHKPPAYSPTYQHYNLQNAEFRHISNSNDPLFIISPVGIATTSNLEKHIKKICEEFQFQRNDIILIEEMDLLTSQRQNLKNYNEMLKKIGFTDISVNKLGFEDGSIGYIPTDRRTVKEIKTRFEGELIKLFDSYNVDLSGDNSYHLAYISSDTYICGAQVFIGNTLNEIVEDERNATFIMTLRQLHSSKIIYIMDWIEKTLKTKEDVFDYESLFSKATITAINSDNGDIENQKTFTGSGTKKISIIITNKLPQNIFDDFLMLADTGMASGDQSISEYLTLKGNFPYYDMQPWKYPLVNAIKKIGGQDLEKYIDHRIIGEIPYSGELKLSWIPNVPKKTVSQEQKEKIAEFDKVISSKKADRYISKLIQSRMHSFI